MDLSIVSPVFNEEASIAEFLRRTTSVCAQITPNFEIILALDPSRDRTEEIILAARTSDSRIKLLKFSRQFGQPMATLAGLEYSTGDAIVVIDADLQDPPEMIPEMLQKYREGYDVVYAQRKRRLGEPLLRRTLAAIWYWVLERFAEVRIPRHTSDFRVLSRRVVEEVVRLKERHGFLRGMVALVGFRQTAVQFDRPERFGGKTHYNPVFGSLTIGLNGVFCFSNRLLRLSSGLGFGMAATSFMLAITYFFMKVFGFPFPMGNPTIVILLLLMSGIQLITIGILGEYIARIYDEVRERPRFIIDQKIGFDRDINVAPIRANKLG